MTPIRIALVGLGKIARDQHPPAIAASDAFDLVSTVSPEPADIAGVPHFARLALLLKAGLAVDAVALCTPPQVRGALAFEALGHGLHVLLEKPPGACLSEVAALRTAAATAGTTLFAGWHSRFAGGVEPARAWLAQRAVHGATITWREDVRVWHPGQEWIWQPGGLGVFDPGINALSIATAILPRELFLAQATLAFPANRAAPIAAQLALADTGGAAIAMDLDWRQTGPQTWDIVVETDAGRLALSQGGSVLALPEGTQRFVNEEYRALYARFAALVQAAESEVDIAPFRLVADVFLRGHREPVADFID